MPRLIRHFSLFFSLLPLAAAARGAEPAAKPPTLFEVRINGEVFRVPGSQVVKVESKTKPGTTYEIAVRMAPIQSVRLDTIQLDYSLPAKMATTLIKGDPKLGPPLRGVDISNELGFDLSIVDLGGPLDAKSQDNALDVLISTVKKRYADEKEPALEVGKPYERKFDGSTCRGVTVHYIDARQVGHTHLVYVLSGPKFTATCTIEYLDLNEDTVLPAVRKLLDSIRAAPEE
jgi:hypothetical protein